jgi:hypothetical protein
MAVQNFEDSDASLASESIEGPLCAFLEQFDGTAKDFGDVRSHFNELFSEDLIYCLDGRPIDRQTFMSMNKYIIEHRMIATLEDIYFSDDTHIEYTVHWSNGEISMVTHVTGLVNDGKIIKLEPCPETSGVFANMLGPTWRKAIASQVDKRILSMKQWALTQRNTRAA